MAWRIAGSVVRGEIDNRTRGRVTGRLWLAGREEPIVLDLTGNCHRDLAGCTIAFTNPSAKPADLAGISAEQRGCVGDITASRKIYVLDVPTEQAMQLGRDGQDIPKHQANCLYIEWFSERNGRVVVESTDFVVQVSVPAWSMTEDDQKVQTEEVHNSFRHWLDRFDRMLAESEPEADEDDDDDRPLNEFEWEKRLKESDVKSEKLGKVFEKYHGHPDCEKLVAREMGWKWMEEELEAEERGILSTADETALDEDLFEGPEPNPATEDIDWIRDEDGRIHHPLYAQSFNLGIRMWRFFDEHDQLGDQGDQDVHDYVFQMQMTSAKLASSLNGLAYDRQIDHGYVVAGLKRALNYLHKSLEAEGRVVKKGWMDPVAIEDFHREMFQIREKILALMIEHRGKITNNQ